MRGKKGTYSWGGTQKTLTEILQDTDVQSYVSGTKYASKREKLRKLLNKNEISLRL